MSKLITGPWTAHEMGRAASIWQDTVADVHGDDPPGHVVQAAYKRIGIALNRGASSVQSRHRAEGPGFGINARTRNAAPGAAELQRQARERALAQQSLIGRIMGDPSPGYSALDRGRSHDRSPR
ncbi:hypothetical protein [Bradyrhizobium sp. SRS-191]|uniref:hypothetical protein n=1 Tax=Bradyrhizobium sp. SRS-191 TaxID=2962606 RepID=UPI00211F26C2|nr:hypothetical protein [Bradyrhizobium sp. SRS-191]